MTFFSDADIDIGNKLREEVYKRAIGSALAHILLMLLFFAITWNEIYTNVTILSVSFICIIFDLFRILASITFKRHNQFSFYINWGHDLGAIISALSWGTLLSISYLKEGLYSTSSIALYVIISGISGGAIGSLSSQKKLFISFMFFILVIPGMTMIINEPISRNKIFGLFLLIYAFFLSVQSKQSRENLIGKIKMEGILSQEKQKLEDIFNSIPGLVALVDQQGTINISNNEWKHYYPKPTKLSEIDFNLGEKIYQFKISTLLVFGLEVELGEMFNYQLFLINMKKIGLKNDIIFSLTNITESKKLQIENQKHIESMKHTARMIEIGEMVSGVAHEIRNPLTIAVGKVQLAERAIGKTEVDIDKIKSHLSNTSIALDRIMKIIDRMRAIARKSEDDPLSKESISSILDVAYLMTSPKLKDKEIELIKTSLDTSQLFINCRPSQIEQVLIVLINNSADAIEHFSDKWIKIEVKEETNKVIISVSDSGKGIPQDIQIRIWDSFFTTKDVGKGTGLGLSIAKQIMHPHGGTIEIDNNVQNTTFNLTFPKSS